MLIFIYNVIPAYCSWIFIDTPGVHKAHNLLNVRIVEIAINTLGDVDAILVLLDASRPDPVSEGFVFGKLADVRRPVVLALNKIDRVEKYQLLKMIDRWVQVYPFKAIVPISARHNIQVAELIRSLEELLPEGPPFFPQEHRTTPRSKRATRTRCPGLIGISSPSGPWPGPSSPLSSLSLR